MRLGGRVHHVITIKIGINKLLEWAYFSVIWYIFIFPYFHLSQSTVSFS